MAKRWPWIFPMHGATAALYHEAKICVSYTHTHYIYTHPFFPSTPCLIAWYVHIGATHMYMYIIVNIIVLKRHVQLSAGIGWRVCFVRNW